jgi:hypothetical protein
MPSSKKTDAITPNDKIATTTTTTTTQAITSHGRLTTSPNKEDVNDHLPPILLVFTVVACSGFLFMYAFRDVFATGRTIGGDWDDAYLVRSLGDVHGRTLSIGPSCR